MQGGAGAEGKNWVAGSGGGQAGGYCCSPGQGPVARLQQKEQREVCACLYDTAGQLNNLGNEITAGGGVLAK